VCQATATVYGYPEGHELANHSYTHADVTELSDAEIRQELRDTEAAVQGIVGPDVSVRRG
jgi:peptidoglycan/xylan/chitin deacetylase (PgdA/CDA1 family)